jgi:hypothetical protein
MTPIPVGSDHVCVITGRAAKLVRCEACRLEFVYVVERSAESSAFSLLFLDESGAEKRAAESATRRLNSFLDRAVDPVPCPGCGWVQRHMFRPARALHRRGLLVAGGVVAIGVIPLTLVGGLLNALVPAVGPAIPWPLFLKLMGLVLAIGVGLMLAKVVLAYRFDPNAGDRDLNRMLGRERAWPRDGWEQFMGSAGEGMTPPNYASQPRTCHQT